MKYKRIMFISLLLSLIGLMCLFVFAEKEVLPIITWDRTYGGSVEDRARSLIQTTDGGYMVAGWTRSKGAGDRDFWVIKLDAQGKSPEKIDTQNTGAINLTSTPSGAKVFLDAGQYMGKTPLPIDKVSPGKHKVTLVLADYEKYVQEVNVIAGKVVDVSATFPTIPVMPKAILPEANDATMAQIKGKFVDKDTGRPLQITPLLWLTYPEDITEDEKAKLSVAFHAQKVKTETDSSGAFSIVIVNVVPGKYALLTRRYGMLTPDFAVSPGEVVNLGTIKVKTE